MARSLQTKLIRVQPQTFADWNAEIRDLAGERRPEVRTNVRLFTPCGAAARRLSS